MNNNRLQKVLTILVILILTISVTAAQPALAGRGGGGSGSGYGSLTNYGSGGSGYGERSDYGGCSDRSDSEAYGMDAAPREEAESLQPPTLASKVFGAAQGGRPLRASLSGADEVPGPGDMDGSGTALITFNQGQGLVCWELSATDILTATAAHIHAGEMGIAGPVVVALSPPEDGSSSGCASVDPTLIMEIRQNPEGYYVNVHTSDFPSGALRGQLGK